MDWETILADSQPGEGKVEYYSNLLNLKSDNARLVTEIDKLSSQLDATQLEKGKGLTKITTLQQTLRNYKRKCKELIDALDILERVCGRYHKDCNYYRDKWEKSLADIQDLRNERNNLSREIEKLDSYTKQIKGESAFIKNLVIKDLIFVISYYLF